MAYQNQQAIGEYVTNIPMNPTAWEQQDYLQAVIAHSEQHFEENKDKAPEYDKWNATSICLGSLVTEHYYKKDPHSEYFKFHFKQMWGFCKWWNAQNFPTGENNEWNNTVQDFADNFLSFPQETIIAIFGESLE